MGEALSPSLRKLLKEKRITRSRTSRSMVLKELKASTSDLTTAKESYNANNFKWATVQAYYSVFHAARALLYDKGFREKSHRGLLKALAELYPVHADSGFLEGFEESMNLREEADYGLVYSEQGAKEALEDAEVFLRQSRRILKSRKRTARTLTTGEDLLSFVEKSPALSPRSTKSEYHH